MITEEQKIARKNGIGGSDMPIILGLSTYKTPYQLYCEKKGIIQPDTEESNFQYWGNQLEPVIRKEFAKRNHVKVLTPKETITHPFYDFLRGNIDGYIPKWNSIFEAKCSHAFMAKNWGDSGCDVIPMEYLVQVAFYCCITNSDSAHIAVLIGGNEYREFKYSRDLDLENNIINSAANFWHAIQNDMAPPATAMIDLKIMHPSSTNGKKKLTNDETSGMLCSYKEIKEKIKQLEDQANKDKIKILTYMEDAECLMDDTGNYLATWKSNKNGARAFLIK